MAIIYKSVSVLSGLSKIFEAEINFRLVQHVLEANKLITDKQWAYRRGDSPELLLGMEKGSVLVVAFVDF